LLGDVSIIFLVGEVFVLFVFWVLFLVWLLFWVVFGLGLGCFFGGLLVVFVVV